MSSKILEKIKSDDILNEIIENFNNDIYLVGGTVRDYFMGFESHDRDLIILDEDAKIFSQKAALLLDATFVPLDEVNKIYRLVMPDKINYIDITNPIGGSLEKDLLRRDLTINAIAVNLKTSEVVDLSGGISDIQNKNLQCVNEKNFEDDPLRILRVYRFQALYDYELSDDTLNAICKYSNLISKPAVERINYELLRLFGGKYAHKALENMDKTGILEKIFPFVNELKKVPPNSHHHLDLFHHSLETVNQIQILYESASKEVKDHLNSSDFGGHTRLAHLKLAGFMHDVGKFSTWTIEENGRHRFIKHDDIGSKMAEKILKNMHFSNKQITYISLMIKNHIYPSSVMSSEVINDKIMMRYLRKMENSAVDAIILAQADRLSARGIEITEEIVKNNINSLNKLLEFCLTNEKLLTPLPKLLDGNDVMEILNIKPSKILGEIMNALYEAQLSGEISDKEHAISFVKSYKTNKN